MKVSPYGDSSAADPSHTINYWKVKFHDNITESNYQKSETKEKTSDQKISWFYFQCFHHTVLLIYTVAYLLSMLRDFSVKSLVFQLIFILVTLFGTSGIFYSIFYEEKTTKTSWKLKTCYLGVSIVLILNDTSFQQLIFNGVGELPLRCLPGLIVINFLYLKVFTPDYIMLMLSNLTISLFYVLTRSTKVKRTEVYIIELCLLVCVQVHQVLIIYSSHLNSRKNFVKKTLIPIAETEKMIDVQDSTLPNIKITESIEELNNLLPFIQENFKYPIERAVLLLQSLSNDMTNKFSLSPNLDTIVKDLDEEDKTYIRQSWSNSDMLHIRKREKAKEKKSIEKVLNKYFNIDIILILKQISINWNVDIISLNTRTNKSPLAALGKYCIKYYNLNESFDIAEDKISNFFLALEKNYKPNPYHNSMHAADVLASGLYIITNSFLASTLSDIEALIVILSHLGHDVGHPGYTNRFLVNFRDKIAMECKKYLDNDISVLENMHCSKTFLLLSEPDKNLLYNLDNDQFLLVRKWVIELILATDMGKHFELLGLFKSKSYSAKNIENLDCKLDVLKIIIKASDIGHAAKTIEFHVNWSLLITEEFFRQGDIEKENSRPVSMYCDRETTIISKSQIGFLKNIALPLYETLSLFLNSESFDSQCIEQIKNNISSWEFEYSSNSHKTMKEIQLVQSGSYKNDNTPDVVSLNGFKSISSLVHAKNK